MTPDEAAKRFDNLQKIIARDLPLFIQNRIAKNAVSMIHNRVVNTQKNYLGGNFSQYSRTPILTSGKTAKSKKVGRALASSKAKRKQLKWVTVKSGGRNVSLFELKGGYAELRSWEGFTNIYKSFEFTTQMWRGFGVKRTQKTPTEIIITIGGKNLESQKKIDVNSRREGINIINISDSELKELAIMVDKELQRYVTKAGLA
jgi:hypothetical protein